MRLGASLGAVALALAACAAPPPRTTQLPVIDQRAGYRFGVLEQAAPKAIGDTFIVATFSGGGTRAAALATGALRALAATRVPAPTGETVLADEVDLVSSVSGGSVAAAYFALEGRAGLAAFERDFLKRDVQGRLVRHALNPVTWARLATPAYARIDALRDYFDEHVFAEATYADLVARAGQPPGRRPYVVLNAADMTTGAVFSFTQDQFDLICADLMRLKLADAVAASAAFPGALTALTLRNYAPCPAQAEAAQNFARSGWRVDPASGRPRPLRVTNDLAAQIENPGRYRRGAIARLYLNEDDPPPRYVQLLDGGIADNLGLTEPLTLVTSSDRTPAILGRIRTDRIKRLAFIVVNARSEPDTQYAERDTPPSLVSTLLTTIGTPIDGTSFLLLDALDKVIRQETQKSVDRFVVPIDFDFIADAGCRRRFKNVRTSWALAEHEVDALIALGDAMVRGSGQYQRLVAALGGTVAPGPTVAAACALLAPPPG
jgi:NTE family protein